MKVGPQYVHPSTGMYIWIRHKAHMHMVEMEEAARATQVAVTAAVTEVVGRAVVVEVGRAVVVEVARRR